MEHSLGSLASALPRVRRPRPRWLRIPARLWLPALYVLLVPVPNNVYVPAKLRLLISNYRPYTIPPIIALIVLSALNNRRAFRAFVQSRKHTQCLALALAFPFFYVLLGLVKPEFRPTSALLYAVWVTAAFLGWPLLTRTRRDFDLWIRILLVANLLDWLIPFVYSPFAPPVRLHFRTITSYGYLNPDYFAEALQVVSTCALWMQPKTRGGRWLQRILVAITLVTCAALHARNVLVFFAVTLVLIRVLRRTRRPGLVTLGALVLSGLVAVFASGYIEQAKIDEFSSGRIGLWKSTLRTAFEEGNNASVFLFGPDHIRGSGGGARVGSYDPLTKEKNFSKYHADNSYLELFIESGALGMILFVLPYLLAVLVALRRIRRYRDRGTIWAVAVLLGIAAQSMFASTVPTFAAPVAFLFLTAVTVALGRAVAATRTPTGQAGQVRHAA